MQLQHFLRRRDEVRFVVYQQDVCHEYPAKDYIFVWMADSPAAPVITSLPAFYPYRSVPLQPRSADLRRRAPPERGRAA
jgi:hypothetical protein